MISTIYIEEEIASHPRTLAILERFPETTKIMCERYGEIFNRKSQNFRLQKKQPALILARKHKSLVLPTPIQYGIGAEHNYYFSHMLNCLYDCRYCFLQGMFQSAHYILFVNYEDFIEDMNSTLNKHNNEPVHFFSGYDCDSLALDPVTDFTNEFLPFFERNPQALLELRTKSTQIRSLLKREPIKNCVIAFSFTPDKIAQALEHKAPDVNKRLQAILDLQEAGWQVGLRFDPLIYTKGFANEYSELFDRIFTKINPELTHSVSLGTFRLPKDYFRKLEKLYPDEKLFASPLTEENNSISYPVEIRDDMLGFCKDIITKHIPSEKFFPCY
ncbi:MAG TPA: DNA photolyase [Thiotrichaceae bacterium]|jgi:spore photoproduct lyase|nr:DNA photolyase [Thiotrichaceae bacterium]HIM08763.1 DNA photolyase [Gammaproteobacteria bacterium]